VLIDDLGTEAMLNNITVELLFTLLSERCAARRLTVIATNLMLATSWRVRRGVMSRF
jgi:DNA replication protein DnaC